MTIKHFIFIISICFYQSVIAETFVEGKDYIMLHNGPAQSQHGVVEYFSFRCPACLNFESLIKGLKTQHPPMILNRVHVDFGNRESKLSQITYALLMILQAEHLTEEIFQRFQRGEGAFRNKDELIVFFQQYGFDKHEITQKIKSFATQSLVKTFNKKVKDNEIQRIPSLVINNKYQVINRAIDSSQKLSDLVSYLNTLP